MAAYAFSTASGNSTSGTYSTTYTSIHGSVVSSKLDLASRHSRIHLSSGLEDDEEKLKKTERAQHLLKEFSHGDDDIGAAERWLSELGVGWVLDLADDPSAGCLVRAEPQRNNNISERWIRALTEIKEYICLVLIFHGMVRFEGRFVRGEQDVPIAQLARFVEAAVLKMLPFVDALSAATDPLDASTDTAWVLSADKIQTLLDVRDAVSSTSVKLRSGFCDFSEESHRSSDEVLNLLSAKEQRLN
ncbi:unnamed protein product [Urochloa humidicola]